MGEILRPFGDHPEEPVQQRTVISRPDIQFEEGRLVVSFPHPARETVGVVQPEEPEATTSFLVDPTRDLYPGLLFIPRSILEEVTQGLESYLEDEEFEEEQRALIVHGVFRLNKFLDRGELER